MSDCTCPTCRASRALKELEAATEAWLEREAELEGRYYLAVDLLVDARDLFARGDFNENAEQYERLRVWCEDVDRFVGRRASA